MASCRPGGVLSACLGVSLSGRGVAVIRSVTLVLAVVLASGRGGPDIRLPTLVPLIGGLLAGTAGACLWPVRLAGAAAVG